MKNPFNKKRKMVIIITQEKGKSGGFMTTREIIGDDLEKEEDEFVYRRLDPRRK